jgi:hypothetical protein
MKGIAHLISGREGSGNSQFYELIFLSEKLSNGWKAREIRRFTTVSRAMRFYAEAEGQ